MSNPQGVIGTGRIHFADPAHIVRRPGWNARVDFGDLSDIEKPMRANGFHKHQPLLVRRNADGKFELIDGDRRFTVVEKLIKDGVKFDEGIPIIMAAQGLSDDDALVMMLTSNRGKPLLPLEEAAAYHRFVLAGKKPKEIGALVGKSEGHVKWTLELLNADDSVKEAVKKGEVSATLAKTIATKAKGNAAKQKELVAKAKQGKKGKAAAKREAVAIMKNPNKKRTATVGPATPSEVSKMVDDTSLRLQDASLAMGESEVDFSNLRSTIQATDDLTQAFYYGVLCALKHIKDKSEKITL